MTLTEKELKKRKLEYMEMDIGNELEINLDEVKKFYFDFRDLMNYYGIEMNKINFSKYCKLVKENGKEKGEKKFTEYIFNS